MGEDGDADELARLSEEEALRRFEEINDEILQRLERIAPGFQAWAKRLERDESR